MDMSLCVCHVVLSRSCLLSRSVPAISSCRYVHLSMCQPQLASLHVPHSQYLQSL